MAPGFVPRRCSAMLLKRGISTSVVKWGVPRTLRREKVGLSFNSSRSQVRKTCSLLWEISQGGAIVTSAAGRNMTLFLVRNGEPVAEEEDGDMSTPTTPWVGGDRASSSGGPLSGRGAK